MKRRGYSEERNPESGFALLFIYALAATTAILLFMELPRVAFEAQRDKEQLLIDRGETYSRAIQLYVRKFNRYPPDFDALDNTQNLRFLRQHYSDPMTGKDEWRLIHVGPGGVFTDSLIYNKKPAAGDSAAAPQNFIAEAQQVGGNQTDATQGVNIAGRVRPSDAPGAPGAPGDPNNPQVAQPQLVPDPGTLQPVVPQPGQPGLIQPGLTQPGLTQPGAPQFDANGNVIPNTVANGPNPPPGFPGQPQNPLQPGTQPTANGSPAGAGLIGQLLTTPRPGGLNGLSGSPAPAAANTGGTLQTAAAAPTIGGGIAGVASKREQEGIKIYKDKTKYNEWEFVYDISKDQSRTGAAAPGQQQQQPQQPGNAQPAQTNPQQTTPPSPPPSPPQ